MFPEMAEEEKHEFDPVNDQGQHCKDCSWWQASQEALRESIQTASKLNVENCVLRKALEKLRDCDWVISLPDRMDAVRKIAKEALEGSNEITK